MTTNALRAILPAALLGLLAFTGTATAESVTYAGNGHIVHIEGGVTLPFGVGATFTFTFSYETCELDAGNSPVGDYESPAAEASATFTVNTTSGGTLTLQTDPAGTTKIFVVANPPPSDTFDYKTPLDSSLGSNLTLQFLLRDSMNVAFADQHLPGHPDNPDSLMLTEFDNSSTGRALIVPGQFRGMIDSLTQTAGGGGGPPEVTCTVAGSLWPPNHKLVNVGLDVTVSASPGGGEVPPCDEVPAAAALETASDADDFLVDVMVYSDDEEATGDGNHSPDAKDMAPGTLRLRSERKGDGDGRVYLIVVIAADDAGQVGFTCCTVTVPHGRNKASLLDVALQAENAEAYCLAHDGMPRADYFLVGDGPEAGPKQ